MPGRSHPAIRATLRGILRQHGKPVRPAAALTSKEVRLLLGSLRRRSWPACATARCCWSGLAGALRRSELVAIDRAHLRFLEVGLVHRTSRAASATRKDRGRT